MKKIIFAFLLATGIAHAQTIKIGVITDRVGVSKPYSEPATEGVVFGADEINRKGGVLGRKIELLIEDDQSRPDISAALARKLVDQGAVFILSMSLTPATQQQQTVTMEATPYVDRGRTIVPLSFVSKALDVKVTFNAKNGHLLIESKK